MSQLRINITDPCHEDWNKMQSSANGRHCSSCEKTVVDFTGQNRQQIESYLILHADQKICGRMHKTSLFHPDDIQTAAIAPTLPVKLSWFRSRWMAIVAAVSLLVPGKKAQAGPPPVFDLQPGKNENSNIKAKQGQTVVHGCIRNSDHKGIARAEVWVYSGGKEIAYSKSFANGSYFITIPENTIWDYTVTLEYNAIGFHSQILRDVPVNKDRVALDVAMLAVQQLVNNTSNFEAAYPVMGELEYDCVIHPVMPEPAVMGGISYERVMGAEMKIIKPETHARWVEDTTATNPQKAELSIKTYPNPSTGIFNVELDNSEYTTLMVFNLQGGLLFSKKAFSSIESIDLTNQPNGTYVVLAIDETSGLKKQSKVIKMQ